MQNSLAEIAGIIQSRSRFVVMSHARPDGDALGYYRHGALPSGVGQGRYCLE